MKTPCSIIFLTAALTFPSSALVPVPDTKEMGEARQIGVTVVQLMQKSLSHHAAKEDPLPGIKAWMNEEGKTLAALDQKKPDQSWRDLDGDKLLTHSANFWQLYYEVAPGDPGLYMLHAGGLMTSGDPARAQILLRLVLHRGDVDEQALPIIKGLLAQSIRFMAPSNALAKEGVALHDKKDYTGALEKYDAALQLWPLNGTAAYEKALTLRARDGQDGDEAVKLLAQCRQTSPAQWPAWQGDSTKVPGMMAIQRTVRPLWEKSFRNLNTVLTEKELEQLAIGWQEAELDDLALATRQILIAKRGRYLPEDHPFISKSLTRLGPGKQAEDTLKKLSGTGTFNAIQLFGAPPPGKAKKKDAKKDGEL